MLTQVKKLSSELLPAGSNNSVASTLKQYYLDYHQCKYVKLVYQIVKAYNSLEPKEALSDEDMVMYFNHIFQTSFSLEHYQRIWQNPTFKRSL